MVVEVMTTAAIGVLADTDPTAVVVFNPHSWTASNYLRVDTKNVMLNSDVDSSLFLLQTAILIPPGLLLTTITVPTIPADPHVGLCIYDSGSAVTTDSTVLRSNGGFVVLKQTITFDCIVTVQPISIPLAPTPDANYPVGTLIPCQYTFTTEQSKLRA